MFHLESESKLASAPAEQRQEIEAGQLVVGEAENPQGIGATRRGRRRNK